MTRRRSDRGTSLLEVMITVVLMSVALAATFGVFSSVLRADHSNAASIEDRQAAAQALGELAHDLRAAQVIVTPPTSAAAAEELEVGVAQPGGGVRYVRFVVDAARGSVVRTELDGPGGRDVERRTLHVEPDASAVDGAGAAVDGADLAPFRYFAADGRELVAGVEDAATLAACTMRLRLTVAGASTDVAFRSLRPEEATC